MGFVLGLMSVIAVIASILLTFIVLLQEPKGGGIAAALGGSGMEAIGPATGGVNRFTSWIAGIWMVVCFAHAIFLTQTPMPVAKPTNTPADTGGEKPADTGGEKPADTPPK